MGARGPLPENLEASFSWTVGDGKTHQDLKGPALHDVRRHMIDQIELKVQADGVHAGDISIEPDGNEWVIASVNVQRKFQRRGVASWMLTQTKAHLDEHHLDTQINHNRSLSEDGLDWAMKIDRDPDSAWRQENADRVDGRIRKRAREAGDPRPGSLIESSP